MYRQGLGDCFLLTFAGRESESHVLIDCGVLVGTENAEMRVRAVAQSILECTKGKVGALIATHEHWDHVSGFAQAQDIFKDLEIDQVWLAWTEDPDDEVAKQLADRKAKALRGIVAALQRLSGVTDAGAQRTARRLNGLLEFWGGLPAAGRKTTRSAMDWVKARREKAPAPFLHPGMAPLEIPGVDGVRVYVLGPPRDLQKLRKSDPSKRQSEIYDIGGTTGIDLGFLAAAEQLGDHGATLQPFDAWFCVDDAEAAKATFYRDHYGQEGEEWRTIEHDWLDAAGPLALQLDSHTNNTSLVLAFELVASGRVLLFPGDAQVGNWLSWESLEWKIEENGKSRTVTAADLLARTVLYKVGHHGSHNATLREKGLELMSSPELTAMLPVHRGMAKKMDWDMPFPSLYQRLEQRTKGRILDVENGVPASKPDATGDVDWNRFVSKCKTAEYWVDFHVDV